jgi:hypothetical protein
MAGIRKDNRERVCKDFMLYIRGIILILSTLKKIRIYATILKSSH